MQQAEVVVVEVRVRVGLRDRVRVGLRDRVQRVRRHLSPDPISKP